MNKEFNFIYNPKTGMSICDLVAGPYTIRTYAYCHPDDREFGSERVGCFIAEMRATIKYLQFKRDYEIKPALKTIKHLYDNIKTSKNYNPKSYETKMIRRQIRNLEKEINTINYDINSEKQYLFEYIQNKEILYDKYR